MARYDKYDPVSGGFRAPLAADLSTTDTVIGVGLDASGNVVPGAGQSGVVGAVVVTREMNAGDIVDVMTDGEVVEAGLTAGTAYYAANADGAVATTGDVYLGHTVEADRLVVRAETGRASA